MTTQTIDTRGDRRAAGWLSLAAAPTFVIMALFSGMSSANPQDVCGLMHGSSPLNGMTCMYLLMAAFHSAPWLSLFAARLRHF